MGTAEQELVRTLRAAARAGVSPSRMLRDVVRNVGPEVADRQYLVRLVSGAFVFQEGEGYVIFGWLPDGTGELSDPQLDHHLARRINTTRRVWDDGAIAG